MTQIIRELDDRQQSREKIDIFFGNASNYYHPVKESIQNALDEVENNFENGKVTITLNDDEETVTIKDTGRGMPVLGKTDKGSENWKALFTILFASGKYDNNDSGDTTGGTNGVGNTVTNYTSSYFSCRAFIDGYEYFIDFENGGYLKTPLKKIGKTEDRGTEITFKLDSEIYVKTKFDYDSIKEICKNYSISANNTEIICIHKDDRTEFHYGSIEEYFKDEVTTLTSEPILGYTKTYDYEGEKNTIELIMATSPEPLQKSILNYNYLSEGGTIDTGITRAIKNFLNKYLKDNKSKVKLIDKDIEESVTYVCKFVSTKVSYSNQTKFNTMKPLYQKISQEYTTELMEVFLLERESEFKKFLNHILEVQKFNSNNKKNIEKLKNKLFEKIDTLGSSIEHFDDCKKHGEEAEIFICEGLSAKGSIMLSRNAINQAVIAMKGKVLNCIKANYSEVLGNKVIFNLVRALGCGIIGDKRNKDVETYDESKLRYGKIFLAVDADPDGCQIACLLLTMFYRLMPDLLKTGRIYLVCTPLFENKMKDETMHYTFTEDEQKEFLKGNKSKIDVIMRSKGLGELDATTLAETGINPETRYVKQILFSSKEAMDKSFRNWMADETVAYRKDYLMKHLHEYLFDVI